MALGGSSAEIEIANAETFATAHTLEIRNLDQTDTVLMTPVATTCGGFGKSMVGTKIPNVRLDFTTVPPTPTIPEEYKGDGWSWYGWMGLGGSMIMWDYKRKAAIGYAPTLLGVGGGNNDERAARLNLAFVNAIEAREATAVV
ncbi:hypothetical protein M427DRAFT_458973 [Gonapodya prolifera JEL478]|uniref:Uncharacterized protein n=1 Tax=Gonapodya prolifera (strain JEL478) TaxID=1344416 RepID=A0A139A2E7_GONPJ|nr:hypothetical protein M427DRAFT_458973 [Gonapodya prolifera JEL478]|eukprot:KXS10869.1 hypothetical protein M427DRAFT_458973 [Gonapodya prolifera JEL478]